MLLCLHYSPKANQAMKKTLPLDTANFATHLLCICLAKWQTQYNLMENTTFISTRVVLLMLENIENHAKLNHKLPSVIKAKGAEGKCKMESINSCFPEKPKKVGWTNKHYMLCEKHGGPHKIHNTCDCCCCNKDDPAIKRKGGTARLLPPKRDKMVQFLPRSSDLRLGKHSVP